LTATGKGTCVGRVFDGMQVRIIKTSFEVLAEIDDTTGLAAGQIGEIIVSGPVATREYFRRPDATAMAKIRDGNTFWHRMGDVGYFDEMGRLWFCGRKAHIVWSAAGPMYSVCCESIFNNHPAIFRCALVGIGKHGNQTPVIVAEPESGKFPASARDQQELTDELLHLAAGSPLTRDIRRIVFHKDLPVDTRHNVKINRELLAEWAARL
ncbi:MAG: AMP-binding protein, partial [Planctomycetaceae bacterium]|nr:AMP-binding protein [Planctomycetaceae bacterium]